MGISSLKEKLTEMVSMYPGMQAVEELARGKFASQAPLLREIPEYLLKLGGKRMRPLLALVTARAFGMREPTPALIEVATGIELIHMATLLHDDIIDRSPIRRHQESAFVKYGVPNTLLCGDFLLVRAFSLCARLDQRIITETERACVDLTEGEIEELPLYQRACSIDQYLEIARKKTAALFRLAAFSAGHLATAEAKVSALLSQFGEALGVAFQIVDDILDVAASEEQLGKPIGQDIREHKPSLVNLIWQAQGSQLAAKLAAQGSFESQEMLAAALAEIRNGSALGRARALAAQYFDTAQAALEQAYTAWPTKSERDFAALRMIVEYAIARAS